MTRVSIPGAEIVIVPERTADETAKGTPTGLLTISGVPSVFTKTENGVP